MSIDPSRSLAELEQALCNTHRALLDGLDALELDLHQHVHEENNILFPRALLGAGA
jgi:iron-sulfur cluster repair protein YtfE (RIC family)